MRNLIFRLFFIVLFGGLLFVYVFPWSSYGINIPFSGKDYKLGLDLQGGIELDYKVDLEEARKEKDYNKQKEKSIIEGLKSIIDKRIETLKINDSVITSADYAGEEHIIVQIPLKGNNDLENGNNIKKAKEAIGKVVKIEFKEERTEITDVDIQERKKLSFDAFKEAKANFEIASQKFKDNYENVFSGTMSGTLEDMKNYFSLPENVNIGLYDGVLTGNYKKHYEILDGELVEVSGDAGYWILNILYLYDEKQELVISSGTGTETSTGTELVNVPSISFDYIFINQKPSEWKPAKDKKGRILNDKYFVKSSVQYNEAFQPQVELNFNDEGAEIFGELTSRLIGKPIAIFVGGQLLTAPNVNSAILNGRAVITGDYTPEEASKLSTDINTGVVPAPIYLTSEKAIDSKLGASSLEKLIVAGIVGFLIIFMFLIIVYRLSGFLASISLFMYIVMVLAVIKSFSIVLTLASIAGLILSIGIAIDANILIFERIRDEIKLGKNLNDSVIIGFKKSWSAIWDSNITGFIVAVILFIFGINLIKGFGLILAIGIVVSLFSAMYISRILVVLLSKETKNKKLFIGIKK
ncbi:protein translocase subunit SecD [Candidatus Gracilibacteria bacterium]|nr:MAG: protein translocase subunit SecD [Candidatus Gracilibacteria bacterium]PIE85644.1 MAG: protein translocase subunit SecD [Candidatus Gracilibacteria bacterium]